MGLTALFRAIVHNEKQPPKGVLTSQVSAAMQQHECAIARLNRIACDHLHGNACQCCIGAIK